MAYDFQLAVDCARPHELADWWAQTLGWVVEESDEDFVRKMVAEGYATESDTMIHNGKLVWVTGAAIRHPDGPATGNRKRVIFQQVPEAITRLGRIRYSPPHEADSSRPVEQRYRRQYLGREAGRRDAPLVGGSRS